MSRVRDAAPWLLSLLLILASVSYGSEAHCSAWLGAAATSNAAADAPKATLTEQWAAYLDQQQRSAIEEFKGMVAAPRRFREAVTTAQMKFRWDHRENTTAFPLGKFQSSVRWMSAYVNYSLLTLGPVVTDGIRALAKERVTEADDLLARKVPYEPLLKYCEKFAAWMQAVTLAEPYRGKAEYEKFFLFHARQAYGLAPLLEKLPKALNVDQVVFFPAVFPIGYRSLNHLWAQGIYPLGLKPGDDRRLTFTRTPMQFFQQDLKYAAEALEKDQRWYDGGAAERLQLAFDAAVDGITVADAQRLHLEPAELPALKRAIEAVFFLFLHEKHGKFGNWTQLKKEEAIPEAIADSVVALDVDYGPRWDLVLSAAVDWLNQYWKKDEPAPGDKKRPWGWGNLN